MGRAQSLVQDQFSGIMGSRRGLPASENSKRDKRDKTALAQYRVQNEISDNEENASVARRCREQARRDYVRLRALPNGGSLRTTCERPVEWRSEMRKLARTEGHKIRFGDYANCEDPNEVLAEIPPGMLF